MFWCTNMIYSIQTIIIQSIEIVAISFLAPSRSEGCSFLPLWLLVHLQHIVKQLLWGWPRPPVLQVEVGCHDPGDVPPHQHSIQNWCKLWILQVRWLGCSSTSIPCSWQRGGPCSRCWGTRGGGWWSTAPGWRTGSSRLSGWWTATHRSINKDL